MMMMKMDPKKSKTGPDCNKCHKSRRDYEKYLKVGTRLKDRGTFPASNRAGVQQAGRLFGRRHLQGTRLVVIFTMTKSAIISSQSDLVHRSWHTYESMRLKASSFN